MFDERICIENLRRIISEAANDPKITELTTEALRPTYEEINDRIFQLSVSNCHKFKNMLWNLDNLKLEIRSNFQKKCFDAWYPVYLKSVGRDLSEDTPEDPIEIETEAPADRHAQTDPIQKKLKGPTVESEDSAHGDKQKPAERPSGQTGPNTSSYLEKQDWFDKLLDLAAAVVYGFAGIFGR